MDKKPVGKKPSSSKTPKPQKIYPTSFQTVDIIVYSPIRNKVLIGRKKDRRKWVFPGGFVDPKDKSLEMAACRELEEEVLGIMATSVKYVGSYRIDDPRYRGSPHKIMTALFIASYVGDNPTAADDLVEVRWESLETLSKSVLKHHRVLAKACIDFLHR